MAENEYWLVAVPGENSQRRARDTLSERLKNHAVVVDYPIPELKVLRPAEAMSARCQYRDQHFLFDTGWYAGQSGQPVRSAC